MNDPARLQCPVPHAPASDRLQLAHGEGARLSRRLIVQEILGVFDNPYLRVLGDGAVLPACDGPLVLSTDGFVVAPLIFPGGDIGKLAIHGTVNDLAVCGAEPLYLTLGVIAEEGLSLTTFRQVMRSAAEAARECGVAVVTGDTKVVPRGAADGLFLHTTGVGRLRPGVDLGAERVRPGDVVLVNGTLADHGMAVLAAREGLLEDDQLRSDTAPLHDLVRGLLASGAEVRFLRDATRGGLAAVLHELADAARISVTLDEAALPLTPAVRGACELLGLDPCYVANEGKLVAIVAPDSAERALAALQAHPLGRQAAQIGVVQPRSHSAVLVRGPLGQCRVLDEPQGAPLPRIC